MVKQAGFTSKDMRALLARDNSERYMKDTFCYKGLDGRTYQTDRPMPEHEPKLSKKDIYILKHNEKMSMLELRKMELFLETGTRQRTLHSCDIKKADKERIAAEYPITMNPDSKRYEGDLTEVWAVLKAKYPEATARFPKGYKQAQYALRFGEACETVEYTEGEGHDGL